MSKVGLEDKREDEPEGQLETADICRVLELLPHRYPMLLIDRITHMKGSESAIGIKNVTYNDPFFQGHFPKHPVMPGVLIIEAMAQTAGALVLNSMGENAEDKLVYFMAIDRARFRRPVEPGDVLEVHVHKRQSRGTVWKFHGDAKVNGILVADADYSAMIINALDVK